MEPSHFKSTIFFLVIILHASTIFIISVNAVGQCLQSQSSALLQLKRGFSSSGELDSWRNGTDCCMWDGVTCDEWRRVTGLQLSKRCISGIINPYLFNLTSLRDLNFAYNDFSGIAIPDSGWERLPNLSSLNLSNAGFVGNVPAGISTLSKLTSLDLSWKFYYGRLYLSSKPTFLLNMSLLTELYLDYVNVTAYGDALCGALVNATPALEVLSMEGCFLSGARCSSLAMFPLLSVVRLGYNNLSTSILDSFLNLTSLSVLQVPEIGFKGLFPKQIFHLRNLMLLDIAYNPMLSGSLPDFLESSNLRTLSLSYTNFSGNLTDTIGNLKFLTYLDLSSCQFSGRIPPSIGNLSHVEILNLSDNNFSGLVPFFMPFLRNSESMQDDLTVPNAHNCFNGKLCKLEFLDLSNNSLSGSIFASMFTHPTLKFLILKQNHFSGQLFEFSNTLSLLEVIDLKYNKLYGQIPKSLLQISGLRSLLLASNNFSGDIEWMFTKDPINLFHLDLSNNRIQGKISSWLWNIRELNLSFNFFTHLEEPPFNTFVINDFIDLQSNMLDGPIPALPFNHTILLDLSNNQFTSFISSNISQLKSITYLLLANNNLMGEIPLFICSMTGLYVLDLSNNKLSGYIPSCLFEKEMHLKVLNLQRNRLRGAIPNIGITSNCMLQNINLRDNQLEGLLPISISNCQSLEVLDLGNNKLNDTFPFWLGNMPLLRVLILGSNKFHGLVGPPNGNHETNQTFSMLNVFDISSNNFSGELYVPYLSNFRSMTVTRTNIMHINPIVFPYFFDHNYVDDLPHSLEGFYYDTFALIIMNKGKQMTMKNIWNLIKIIDFSNNYFEGGIPITICELISLQVLNLSHNYLIGEIIPQFSSLAQLESLDLSMNSLSGKIPQELVNLNFLEYLNLSYNMLIGGIPIGGQFSTFPNTSFEGNKGLCWFSCNKSIPEVNNTTSSLDLGGSNSKSKDYIILMGVLFGVGFGVSLAITMMIDAICCDRGIKRRSRGHVHG